MVAWRGRLIRPLPEIIFVMTAAPDFSRRFLSAVAVLGLALAFVPAQALAQRPLGVDVSSYYDWSINWTNVKSSGISFAWAKATEGVSIHDAYFTLNAVNAKAAGVYIGAYDFAHPENEHSQRRSQLLLERRRQLHQGGRFERPTGAGL